jgi:hypothetical protein
MTLSSNMDSTHPTLPDLDVKIYFPFVLLGTLSRDGTASQPNRLVHICRKVYVVEIG